VGLLSNKASSTLEIFKSCRFSEYLESRKLDMRILSVGKIKMFVAGNDHPAKAEAPKDAREARLFPSYRKMGQLPRKYAQRCLLYGKFHGSPFPSINLG
jgi:hypothetical protein